MNQNRSVFIFENPHTLTNYLIKRWEEICHEAINYRYRFTVALSGGRSPVEFYSKLSGLESREQWLRTHIFLVDERFVPHDDAKSNFRFIQETFLNYVPVLRENIHPIPTDVEDVNLAAQTYKDILMRYLPLNEKGLPRLDFVLLGVGEDGHTASLFPEDPNITQENRLTLAVSLNSLKEERVSLSVPVINNARHIIFLVLGKPKAAIMKRILEDGDDLPSSRIRPTQGELSFLLDREAADALTIPSDFTHQDHAIVLNLK